MKCSEKDSMAAQEESDLDEQQAAPTSGFYH